MEGPISVFSSNEVTFLSKIWRGPMHKKKNRNEPDVFFSQQISHLQSIKLIIEKNLKKSLDTEINRCSCEIETKDYNNSKKLLGHWFLDTYSNYKWNSMKSELHRSKSKATDCNHRL